MTAAAQPFEYAMRMFRQMPAAQFFFLVLFAATWLIGANVVVAFHHRRLGKPWWSGFKPFAFPFKEFNAREWLSLLCLAMVALLFGTVALSLGP
jgi:hypothetical protein